ncbi:MAG: cellulase family glycosylhydrolase [Butyrivibrio sp.]|nr:cellulase family glycosylhydrolase [Butyrivibrio sp.]
MKRTARIIALTAALLIALTAAACAKNDSRTQTAAEETAAGGSEENTYGNETTLAEAAFVKPSTARESTENGTEGAAAATEPPTASQTGEAESYTDGDFKETEASGWDSGAEPQSPSSSQNTTAPPTTKPQSSGQQTDTQKPTAPTAAPTTSQTSAAPANASTSAAPTEAPAQEPTEAKPVPSAGDFSKTAAEVARAMGDGINLGNTMEATAGGNPWFDVSNVTNWETAWGQPKTTRAMIDGMKRAGFESIRIPIAWSNMMAKDGSCEIPKVFFDRVDEIIGYAYANDMYVIINIHYDGGWWDDFASDEAGTMKRYKAMWEQIAGHYKDYDDKLIFESANEELGDKLGYALVNRINQAFVDLVRSSGGNNGVRYLLIAGYNTDIDKTCASAFKMPSDTCKNHLLISVHYYTPWTYCGMWKDESWGRADYDWGTDADRAEMENYFKKMQKFTDAGYGVIIGEYSALPNYDNGSYTRKDGAVEFLAHVRELSAKYGYAAYLWDTGDWYDKRTCSMRWDDTASLYR